MVTMNHRRRKSRHPFPLQVVYEMTGARETLTAFTVQSAKDSGVGGTFNDFRTG
jgi:hypothetical protein